MDSKLIVTLFASSRNVGLTYHQVRYAIALKKQNIGVIVFTPKNEQIPGLLKDLENEGVIVIFDQTIDSFMPHNFLFNVCRIIKVLKNNKIDIMHANGLIHAYKVFFATRFIQNKRRPKIVISIHSSSVMTNIVTMSLLKYVSKYSKFICPLSTNSKNILLKSNFTRDKVHQIYNAIDIDEFDNNIKNNRHSEIDIFSRISSDSHIIAYVAMFRPLKGHAVIVEAAKEVLKNFPNSIFLFIGEGPEITTIQNLVSKYGLDKNFIFSGLINNNQIPAILNRIDIGISASYAEQFSHTIIEYMAASKPVIATPVGAVPEIIINNINGFIVSEGDSNSLAKFIIYLLNNPDIRCGMGRNNRDNIEKFYSLTSLTTSFLKLYNEDTNE